MLAQVTRRGFLCGLAGIAGCSVAPKKKSIPVLFVTVHSDYRLARVGEWVTVYVTVLNPSPLTECHFEPFGLPADADYKVLQGPSVGSFVLTVRFRSVGTKTLDLSKSRLVACTDEVCLSSGPDTFVPLTITVLP